VAMCAWVGEGGGGVQNTPRWWDVRCIAARQGPNTHTRTPSAHTRTHTHTHALTSVRKSPWPLATASLPEHFTQVNPFRSKPAGSPAHILCCMMMAKSRARVGALRPWGGVYALPPCFRTRSYSAWVTRPA